MISATGTAKDIQQRTANIQALTERKAAIQAEMTALQAQIREHGGALGSIETGLKKNSGLILTALVIGGAVWAAKKGKII